MLINTNFVSQDDARELAFRYSLDEIREQYRRARGNVVFYQVEGDDVSASYWQYYMSLCYEASRFIKLRTQYRFNAEWLKSKLDILEYIGRFTHLSRCGTNKWRGLCIFHDEHHPSLFVYPERQDWYCYGCAAGGDIFNFAMLYYGRSFKDILPILASEV